MKSSKARSVAASRIVGLGLLAAALGCVAAPGHAAETFADWQWRTELTLSGYTQAGNLTNFPVLVKLGTHISNFDYNDFESPATGADLRFAGSTETVELNYEIERWDTNGTSFVWVQAPEIRSAGDTRIYAYWGNSEATQPAYTTNGATWSEGYAGVWHMADATTTTIADSTANGYGGTKFAVSKPSETDGIVSRAQQFNGSDAYVNNVGGVSDFSSIQNTLVFTISVFAKLNATSTGGANVLLGTTPAASAEKGFMLGYEDRGGAIPRNAMRLELTRGVSGSPLLSCYSAAQTVSDTGWHHWSAVGTGSGAVLYYDGVQVGSASAANPKPTGDSTRTLNFGRANYSSMIIPFSGLLDEIRISTVARGSNWVWACWSNQVPGSTFVAYGDVAIQSTDLRVYAAQATDIRAFSATLNGSLGQVGEAENPNVVMGWGVSDDGTNAVSAWDRQVLLGSAWAAFESFGTNVSDLRPGTAYFYRCYATNSTGTSWSDPRVFTTDVVRVSALEVSGRQGDAATFNGRVESAGGEEYPSVFFCWDTADRGTAATSDWANATFVGTNWGADGVFSTNVTGLTPGDAYVYRVYATNSTGDAWSPTASAFIQVQVFYVATNGLHNPPFASWTDAATNLHDAVALAAAPQEVWVGSGVFAVSNALVLDRGIVLRGVNGREVTTIWQTAAARVLSVSHADAVVSGLTIANGGVVGNGGYGGGINLTAGTVSHCTVTGSRAQYGGGVYMTGGLLTDCVIASNYQWYARNWYGGGVYVNGASAVVSNCTVNANIAYGNSSADMRGFAGGVYLNAGLIVDSVISNNVAYGRGGGGWVSGGIMRGCTLTGNRAASTDNPVEGGGLYITGGLIENCTISKNVGEAGTARGGGGAYLSGGTLRNCLVVKNTQYGYGGGIYLVNAAAVVENCTVVSNRTTNSGYNGGGLKVSAGTVRNTIAYYNTSAEGTGHDFAGTNNVTFSCAPELTLGEGNIVQPPDFVNMAAMNYALLSGSPGINAGTNQTWMTHAVDLAGNPRIAQDRVDMGAYENQGSAGEPLSCNFTAEPVSGPEPLRVVFTAEVFGKNTQGVTYGWDFEDDDHIDAEGLGRNVVTNDYLGGKWSVRLTVSNALGEVADRFRTDYITVKVETTYVATNGGHVFPYASWGDAATSIVAGIEAAVSNVWVSNGTFRIDAALTLDTALRIQGINGADVTTLQQTGAARVLNISHAGVLLEGLTITGGRNSGGHGGGIALSAGTVRNCRITDNWALRGGGIAMTGGTVENCEFDNNRQWYVRGEHASAIFINSPDAMVTNCVIRSNTSYGGSSADNRSGAGAIWLADGLVVDCLISNNTAYGAYGGGGYISGGILRNSVIRNNALLPSDYGKAGGGLRMAGGLVDRCIIMDNACVGNTQSAGGGGVYHGGGTLRNSLIVGNYTDQYGGGIRMVSTAAVVENCTIVSNRTTHASYNGGGVQQNAIGTIRNTILYYNTSASGTGHDLTSTNGVTYSCAPELTLGEGNIDRNPDFVDAAAGDFRLTYRSPCVDAGTNLPWMASALDLYGNPRLLKGNPLHPQSPAQWRVDMGCSEYLAPLAGTIFLLR